MDTTSSKNKILLFIKLPPPLTGATLMNQYVATSKVLLNKFDLKIIPISYRGTINDKHKYSLKKFFKIIKIHYKLFKEIVAFKPSLVYFQISPLGAAFLRDCTYVFWLKIFKRHTVYHLHGKGIREASKRSVILRSLYKWAFKNSSVICLSNALTNDISEIYNGNPYIVNNGIPEIGKHLERNYSNNAPINILFLSNLLYSKGIIVLLDALTLLDETYHKKIKVNIVGSEADLTGSEINNEISNRNISHFVEFLGPKYGDDKNKIYQNTDILVYPTLNDVWGLVILEAMQFGIPVIASIEGAIPEIVDDGKTGFLVEKNKPNLIAEKIVNLIEDSNLIEKMGLAAREKYLKYYTLDTFEQNMLTTFTDILNKNNELH